MYVKVRGDGDAAELGKALRVFTRLVKKEGLMDEIYKRQEYVKPSKKRQLKRNAARKRRIRDEKKRKFTTNDF